LTGLGAIRWSTYSGGTSSEQNYSLASSTTGNIYLLKNNPTALDVFSNTGSFLSEASAVNPFQGSALSVASFGSDDVYIAGQANNNAVLNKYKVANVSGFVFNDANQNCLFDGSENPVNGMRFKILPGNHFVTTDASGKWALSGLPDGSYNIYPDTIQAPWMASCQSILNFSVVNGSANIPSYGVKSKPSCPAPDITIFAPSLQACANNQTIYVSACNSSFGTIALAGAYADIKLDPSITPQSSSINFFQTGIDTWRFPLNDIFPGQCQSFTITANIGCNVISGQSLCMEATLSPADSCALLNSIYPGNQNGLNVYGTGIPCTMPYDTSSLRINGYCLGGTVYFDIINEAPFSVGDMICYSQVRVYSDGVLIQIDSVQLSGGSLASYNFSGIGKTMRMEVDQHPLYPSNSQPSATVELCGSGSTFIPGLVNALPANDATGSNDIYCVQANISAAPLLKTGFPTGVTSSKFIWASSD
jgi:hypothetical protein